MFTDTAEAAYLQQRIKVSRDMACATTSDCARLAHVALVDQYQRKLAGLRRVPLPIRAAPMDARSQTRDVLVDA
ncbi:MAG: hypothetical protein ABIS14_07570 [Sphingomonas sp.]